MKETNEFDDLLSGIGFRMRSYQRHVAEDLLKARDRSRFIVVSMPTGSGKTILELFSAFLSLREGKRVLVIEPTRFLCDQMHEKLWLRLFNAGKEYEGHCESFSKENIVISTPQTALKCLQRVDRPFDTVVIDEVHHTFGNKLYWELLEVLKPESLIGFTALLPRGRLYSIHPKLLTSLGPPLLLSYDFRELSSIDPTFKPPKAIVDIFESEIGGEENEIYDLLYRGFVWGDPQIIIFLERTFVKYGKNAFCESLQRAIENGRVRGRFSLEKLASFCSSSAHSHKARTLVEILKAYNFPENEVVIPVIAFTSRKASAYEFRDALEENFPGSHAEVLTSDLPKEERLKLLERARKGEVDFIASTLVGEEGVDVPEAGLMIMGDTPKSPLRFYQRIGRLIRISSPRNLKYMAVMATPKTVEYHDLEKAVDNLYLEGVDVGYILYNIEEKSSSMRLMEIISDLSSSTSSGRVPYTLVTRGQEIRDPFDYYVKLLLEEREKHPSELWSLMTSYGDGEDAALKLLTDHLLRGMDEGSRKVMSRIERSLSRGSAVGDVDRVILSERAFYTYDAERLSELLYAGLKNLQERCLSGLGCEERGFRIDRKGFLRLFSQLFPIERIDDIIGELEEEAERSISGLKPLFDAGRLQLTVYGWTSYNPKNYSLSPRLGIRLDRMKFMAQINYYNLTRLRRELYEKKVKLIKLNMTLIGLKAVERFLEAEE